MPLLPLWAFVNFPWMNFNFLTFTIHIGEPVQYTQEAT